MDCRPPDPARRRVLFVCVQNSCRSQMAEAMLRRRGGGAIEVCSAGSRPASRLHPGAVAVMREAGFALPGHRPKPLAAVPDVLFDVVVTLGYGESRLPIRARRRLDWAIPDPHDMSVEELRLVRDHLAVRVEALAIELEREDGPPPRPSRPPACLSETVAS